MTLARILIATCALSAHLSTALPATAGGLDNSTAPEKHTASSDFTISWGPSVPTRPGLHFHGGGLIARLNRLGATPVEIAEYVEALAPVALFLDRDDQQVPPPELMAIIKEIPVPVLSSVPREGAQGHYRWVDPSMPARTLELLSGAPGERGERGDSAPALSILIAHRSIATIVSALPKGTARAALVFDPMYFDSVPIELGDRWLAPRRTITQGTLRVDVDSLANTGEGIVAESAAPLRADLAERIRSIRRRTRGGALLRLENPKPTIPPGSDPAGSAPAEPVPVSPVAANPVANNPASVTVAEGGGISPPTESSPEPTLPQEPTPRTEAPEVTTIPNSLRDRYRVVTGEDSIAKGLPGVGLSAEAVNAAIDRGQEFLWETVQQSEHGFNGQGRPEHLLAALTLLKTDYVDHNPAFESALAEFSRSYEPRQKAYHLALTILLLIATRDPIHEPRLERYLERLVSGQAEDGSWAYGLPKIDRDPQPPRDHLVVLGGYDPSDPRKIEYVAPERAPKRGDNSITQFVVLALREARNAGYTIPDRTWRRTISAFRTRQSEDGGWGYTSGRSYGSMTCSGTVSLAIGRNVTEGWNPHTHEFDLDIVEGLEWLAEHFSLENPKSGKYAFYYLYSLERTGSILGTEFIGQREWYPLGAKKLIDTQADNGSWTGAGHEKDPVVATSFALLFLKRATDPLGPADSTPAPEVAERPGLLDTIRPSHAASRVYFILDASGSMRARVDEVSRFDVARQAVREVAQALPPDTEIALRVFGHRKTAIEKGADEDTELELPFTVDRAELNRVLRRLAPRGKTPITHALNECRHDLQSDQPTTVILLTDGRPDGSRGDAADAAARLSSSSTIDFRTVAFAITDARSLQRLRTLAEAGNAALAQADDAATLVSALQQAALGQPDRFVVLDTTGRVVVESKFGTRHQLPAGAYRLELRFGGEPLHRKLWIHPGRTTRIEFSPR